MKPSVTSVVVADAGPLIALARLDRLGLLAHLFQQVQVPRIVLAECGAHPELEDARRIEAAVSGGLLQACEAVAVEADGLDAGECAAIGRAREIGAALLADDRAARAFASRIGIVVIGTLGVLVRARRLGLVAEVRPLIDQLRGSGHWLSSAAVEQALAAAGELP